MVIEIGNNVESGYPLGSQTFAFYFFIIPNNIELGIK